MATPNRTITLRLALQDETDLAAVLDEFESASPPPDVEATVDDASALGAFDTEWMINLALSFNLGIAGNLIATWVSDRLKAATKPVVLVMPGGERIDLSSDAGRARLAEVFPDLVRHASMEGNPIEDGDIRS